MNYAQTIIKENIVTKEDIQDQLNRFQSKSCYSEIGELLTFSLKNISSEHNRQLFGYIPNLFREIKIENSPAGISPSKLQIGEPVVYKISFPSDHTIKGIPFFYLFCYIKENSSRLNVYFQSAATISNPLSQKQYSIAKKKITFEGVISAFTETESAICISDPGHFVPGLISSFYVGTKQINFASLISNVVESICSAAGIELKDTFLFGSSAGAMGALLSSTYFSDKVQVLSVNSQIITYDLRKVMKTFLGTSDRHILLRKFADRVSCLNRFQQNIVSVPNIYLLANVNDSLHQRNYKFYQLYQKLFTAKGRDNQSVFDSYYGVEGHGRPNKVALRKKIEMARETLRMESNLSNQVGNFTIKANSSNNSFNKSHSNFSHSNLLESDRQMEKGYHQFSKSVKVSRSNVDSEAISKLNHNFLNSTNIGQEKLFDAYISLGDNCEIGNQFLRIGYKESSFFRFTSSAFNTTLDIIQNDFQDIFNRKYIVPRPGCKSMIINNKYDIAFHSRLNSETNQHGEQKFLSTYNFDEVFQDESNKINYLIGKWNKLMNSNKKILFFLKNDSQEEYIDECLANKLREVLFKNYTNHNFQILCIQLNKFKEPQWQNPYLINRYFPFFAPRKTARKAYIAGWNKIFAEFPIRENISPNKQLFQFEESFPSPDYQAKYKSKLSQAEQESAVDIFKIKSLNPKQYPEVGQISPDKSAIVGKQGWFFINSGSNNLMEYHTGKKQLSSLNIDQWNKLLKQRITWHQSHQIDYQHIFIPNKIAVYPEYYAHHIDIEGNRPILQLQQKCSHLFSYPLEVFSRHKNSFRLYEKQNSHWSFWGCYFAYKLLCKKYKIVPNAELLDFPIEIVQKKEDLGDKFGLTEKTLQPNLKYNSQIVHDNQVIKYCHQGSVRVLKNDKISHGKLIIFGDSFSNPGFPNYTGQKRHIARLSSLFAETLSEVHFVWTPWIDYDYIEQEKPDFVLTEMAERFLVRVPDDRDHLPLHEFAAMKIDQGKNRCK